MDYDIMVNGRFYASGRYYYPTPTIDTSDLMRSITERFPSILTRKEEVTIHLDMPRQKNRVIWPF